MGNVRDTLPTQSLTQGHNHFDRPMTREAIKNLKGEIKQTTCGYTCFIPHRHPRDNESQEETEEYLSMYVNSLSAFYHHVENWNHNDLKAGLLADRKTLSVVPIGKDPISMLLERVHSNKLDLSQRVLYLRKQQPE